VSNRLRKLWRAVTCCPRGVHRDAVDDVLFMRMVSNTWDGVPLPDVHCGELRARCVDCGRTEIVGGYSSTYSNRVSA
jgi:hypothetical protein